MVNVKTAGMSAANAMSASADSPQPKRQHTDSETYSKSILGPVYFSLSNLKVAGTNDMPAALAQSPYIVASDEQITVSVDLEFNTSPLSKLLMCLGTTVTVDFGFEGYGAAADEVDVKASIITEKDKFNYTIEWKGTPDLAKLTPGLYQIGATVTVGPSNHPCAQYIYGYGYIERVLLQVYPAFPAA